LFPRKSSIVISRGNQFVWVMKVDNLLKIVNTWYKSKFFLSTLDTLKDFVAIIRSSNGSLDNKTCHISQCYQTHCQNICSWIKYKNKFVSSNLLFLTHVFELIIVANYCKSMKKSTYSFHTPKLHNSLAHANSNVVWIILPKHLTSKLSNPSQRSISSSRPSYFKIIVIIGRILNWGIIRINSKKQSSTRSYMLKFSWFPP
jgi:hypothetical protein